MCRGGAGGIQYTPQRQVRDFAALDRMFGSRENPSGVVTEIVFKSSLENKRLKQTKHLQIIATVSQEAEQVVEGLN